LTCSKPIKLACFALSSVVITKNVTDQCEGSRNSARYYKPYILECFSTKKIEFTHAVKSVAMEAVSAGTAEAAWCIGAVGVHTTSAVERLTLVDICTQSTRLVNDTQSGQIVNQQITPKLAKKDVRA